jgi:hypothetical protein
MKPFYKIPNYLCYKNFDGIIGLNIPNIDTLSLIPHIWTSSFRKKKKKKILWFPAAAFRGTTGAPPCRRALLPRSRRTTRTGRRACGLRAG